MNEKPPGDWREGRRYRAYALRQQGWSQQRIAEALGVSQSAVSVWCRRAATGGQEALRRQPPPGPTPKLTEEQRAALPALIAKGAAAFGYRGDVWTTKRVASAIAMAYGVRYHPAHVSRLLRAAGLSVQQPVRRATQRNEAAIAAWQTEQYPALKKGQ